MPGQRMLVLTAMRAEADFLAHEITQPVEQVLAEKRFVSGMLEQTPVNLTWTGMGKVNAAMVTTMAILLLQPTMIVSTGIAGATNPNLIPGDVVIAEKVAQYDFGEVLATGFEAWSTWNPLTFQSNPAFFPADPNLLQAATATISTMTLAPVPGGDVRSPQIMRGIIVTGDSYTPMSLNRQRLREQFGADACDMESAAIAQVCWSHQVPYITVRGISDTEDTATEQIKVYFDRAVQNAGCVVKALLQRLSRRHAR